MIYLDSNATTPLAPAVLAAMRPSLEEHFGNPSSSHVLGRRAKAAIDAARAQAAAAIGAEPDEIIFTSGGTEASNQAIKGTLLRSYPAERGHLVISALEHPATVEPAKFLERLGCAVSVVGCDGEGVIDPQAVHAALRPDTRLVSIMHANNELGSLQPIREISAICRERNVLLHVDAAQSLGKVPVNVHELGPDLLTIAGHKIHAPKGVGALYVRRGVPLEPFIHGAGHERGLRAGTENTPYLVALGAAMLLAADFVASDGPAELERLREQLAAALAAGIGAGLTVNAASAPRLPNTLSVNFPGVIGSDLLAKCPGLCASTGAACHAGETRMSATLQAIHLPPDVAAGTVRLSLGRGTMPEEVDQAAALLINAWGKLRAGARSNE